MKDQDWKEIFTRERDKAAKRRDDFKDAMAQRKMRIIRREYPGPERDVTEEMLEIMEREVEEYEAILCEGQAESTSQKHK